MRLIVVAVLVLVVAAGCGGGDNQSSPPERTTTAAPETPTTSARAPAPELSGQSLSGESIALGDFRGRPVLINVWSSW